MAMLLAVGIITWSAASSSSSSSCYGAHHLAHLVTALLACVVLLLRNLAPKCSWEAVGHVSSLCAVTLILAAFTMLQPMTAEHPRSLQLLGIQA